MVTKKSGIITRVMFLLLLVIMLFPFYLMIVGAFKGNIALVKVPPDINPFANMQISNLTYVLQKSDVGVWLVNSLIIGLGTALGTIIIAATAGYAFAKISFPGRNVLFGVVMATMILPRQILLIPNFLVALNLGLTDSLIGVILTTIAPPFGIFLCRQFMQSIPAELTEAAEIDGCSEPGKFLRVIIPLSLPALGALGIFAFFGAYNDYLWQLVMISSKELHTVPIGIAMFAQKSIANVGYQFMAAALCTVPLLIVFICCQKFFVKGITMGGVKG